VTLVDTSVWIDYFRSGHAVLARLLGEREVALHPFVMGEIAAGNLTDRAETLDYLGCLPRAPVAQEGEVRHLLESHRLWGRGLDWIDLHLLASAALAGLDLLTADRAMREAAGLLGIPSGR
jgi:predicted nucleic acid-binding protein